VELLELGVFGGENLEWSCFIGSGAAWSSPKHAHSMKPSYSGFSWRSPWRYVRQVNSRVYEVCKRELMP
jgi:hypothetical protein